MRPGDPTRPRNPPRNPTHLRDPTHLFGPTRPPDPMHRHDPMHRPDPMHPPEPMHRYDPMRRYGPMRVYGPMGLYGPTRLYGPMGFRRGMRCRWMPRRVDETGWGRSGRNDRVWSPAAARCRSPLTNRQWNHRLAATNRRIAARWTAGRRARRDAAAARRAVQLPAYAADRRHLRRPSPCGWVAGRGRQTAAGIEKSPTLPGDVEPTVRPAARPARQWCRSPSNPGRCAAASATAGGASTAAVPESSSSATAPVHWPRTQTAGRTHSRGATNAPGATSTVPAQRPATLPGKSTRPTGPVRSAWSASCRRRW